MRDFLHPEKSKLKTKPLMFNTAGVTDEENSPTAAASKEDNGEIEHYKTKHKPSEAPNNCGKEPGFYFLDMDLFAFNLMYLSQYTFLYLAWYL